MMEYSCANRKNNNNIFQKKITGSLISIFNPFLTFYMILSRPGIIRNDLALRHLFLIAWRPNRKRIISLLKGMEDKRNLMRFEVHR